MAQRITRLTTDQKIAGSNPAVLEILFLKNAKLIIMVVLKSSIWFSIIDFAYDVPDTDDRS